ncbi:hypothetical protein B0H10DRAFT_1777329, partial [Mycena sp. CBHHK59/15]
IHSLGLLQQFVRDIEQAAVSIIVIIPGIVVYELDGHKKSDDLGWFARRASQWMLEKIKQRKSVRGQAAHETCKSTRNWKIRERGEVSYSLLRGYVGNDELILDCCLYFRSRFRTALCSEDKILSFESENQGKPRIRTIAPRSSRELARFLLGCDVETFAAYQADYTGIQSLEQDQDDSMDVDEEAPKLTPQQAMDSLHLQIIDHFTSKLVQLVGRVGGHELEDPGSDGGVSASRYAPQWKNAGKPHTEWNAVDCLEYLHRKKPVKQTYPPVEVFLSRPYSQKGARCGREWPYEAWTRALDGLRQVGDDMGERSIQEDLRELARHREAVLGVRG